MEITREKEGYQDRLSKKDVGLREVKTEMGLGGFVWVNIDDNCGPLEEFIDGSLDCIQEEFSTEPLEIISYHKAVVSTNYKLWHDTNRELYHEYLHRHKPYGCRNAARLLRSPIPYLRQWPHERRSHGHAL